MLQSHCLGRCPNCVRLNRASIRYKFIPYFLRQRCPIWHKTQSSNTNKKLSAELQANIELLWALEHQWGTFLSPPISRWPCTVINHCGLRSLCNSSMIGDACIGPMVPLIYACLFAIVMCGSWVNKVSIEEAGTLSLHHLSLNNLFSPMTGSKEGSQGHLLRFYFTFFFLCVVCWMVM